MGFAIAFDLRDLVEWFPFGPLLNVVLVEFFARKLPVTRVPAFERAPDDRGLHRPQRPQLCPPGHL
jgi:hypothetical protein